MTGSYQPFRLIFFQPFTTLPLTSHFGPSMER